MVDTKLTTTSPFEELEAIEKAKGLNAKRALLAKVSSVAKELLLAGYDSSRLYGVKEVRYGSPTGVTLSDLQVAENFLAILNNIVAGKLNARQSKAALVVQFQVTTNLGRKWMTRILRHYLRNGLTAKSFNRQFPGTIKWFKCRLCGTYSFSSPLVGEWVAEPKLDGMRAYIEILFSQADETDPEPGTVFVKSVRALSRSGKPVEGLSSIASQLANDCVSLAERNWRTLEYGLVFDGESIDRNRQKSIGNSRRAEGAESLQFWIWDMLSAKDWQDAQVTQDTELQVSSYRIRRVALEDAIHDTKAYRKVPQLAHWVNPSIEEVRETMMDAIEAGYEGLILKQTDSPYRMGRFDDWLKCKTLLTDEFPLIGVEEGNGRLLGTAGRLVVNVRGRHVRVGTKMSDGIRAYFWKNRERLVRNHTMIEVGFQGMTPDGSLDFPRFLRVREVE